MKSDTYIPHRRKSAADRLKSAYLHYSTKKGYKYSTLFNKVLQCKKVLQYNKVPVCKFAIQPKNCTGLRVTERLRVQYDRTVTSKGFNRSNGLGFQATERLRQGVSSSRTTEGFRSTERLTSINQDLTEKICTERN